MSQKRKVSNPLALAVLACLFERPMHPYEMASTMRERHKDESIKLNYGSLYTVTESLQRHRLIEPVSGGRHSDMVTSPCRPVLVKVPELPWADRVRRGGSPASADS